MEISRKTVHNLASGRDVTVGGRRYNELLKEGYSIDKNGNLMKPIGPTITVSTPKVMIPSKLTAPPKVTIPSKLTTPRSVNIISVPSNPTASRSTGTLPIPEKIIIPSRSIKVASPIILPKSLESPIERILEPNITERIILTSHPNDLLSLYLTDKNFHNLLNTPSILQALNDKFNISQSDNFIQFIKKYNTNIIDKDKHPRLYLYNLENTLYRPQSDRAFKGNFTKKKREILLDWLYGAYKYLNLSLYVFGLTVTTFDIYIDLVDLDDNTKIQLTGIACMSLVTYILDDESVSFKDYLYLVDYIYTKDQIIQTQIDILKKLDGTMIRPSVIFLTDLDNPNIRNLTMFSYFIHELSGYMPSLLAEAINYILTGKYKIYTLTELAKPCRILTDNLDLAVGSFGEIKQLAKDLQLEIKHQCTKDNIIAREIPFVERSEWHIGEFESVCVVGEGVGGEVYKIKSLTSNKFYVLKTIEDTRTRATVELASLKLLACSPYIIKLYGFDFTDDTLKLYLDLGLFSLYVGIKDRLLNKNDIPIYFKNIVEAVDYCHRHDTIHRDIKINNIVFDGNRLVLIDFGLSVNYASFRTYLDPDLTATINYRAPEALLGDKHYDNKIDIWACGLVFYFIVTGEQLINAGIENDVLIRYFKLFGTPTPISWPKIKTLPRWERFKNVIYSKDTKFFVDKLKQYYSFIMPCLELNPERRPDKKQLFEYLRKYYST